MKIEGYCKASELTLKQRKQLINPDFIYDFASNRNPAHFYDLERVKEAIGREEPPVQLLKATSIASTHGKYRWTKKLLKDFGAIAAIKIDLERGGDLKDIYREDLISRIQSKEPAFIELKEKLEHGRANTLQRKKVKEPQQKTENHQGFKLEYDRLVKMAAGYFKLLQWSNAILGDFRMLPVNQKIQQICEDLLPPKADRGKYPYQFKSLDAMELFIEEVLVVMNPPIEEGA